MRSTIARSRWREVSESGDAVTFTFDLHNHSTGWDKPYTCTFTVDNGIITGSSGIGAGRTLSRF